jgi:hypothetical protein
MLSVISCLVSYNKLNNSSSDKYLSTGELLTGFMFFTIIKQFLILIKATVTVMPKIIICSWKTRC